MCEYINTWMCETRANIYEMLETSSTYLSAVCTFACVISWCASTRKEDFSRTHLSMGSRTALRACTLCACERCKGWSGSWSRLWPGRRSAPSPCTRCYCPPTAATRRKRRVFINKLLCTRASARIKKMMAENARGAGKKWRDVAGEKVTTWI